MKIPGRGAIGRFSGLLLAALTCVTVGSTQPAAAQGLFDALFGRPRYVQPPQLPPQASSYADPFGYGHREPRRYSDGGGYGKSFCVRTCDGRYFPLQRQAGVTPAELCQSFCPSSKTVVFSGSKIDHAIASNGTRYADLDNAFVYRDKVVDNCTCNGKDSLGLARLSTTADPTLRAGDIVVTNDGLVNFHGKGSRSAEFTPVDTSSGALAQRLAGVKILPASAAPKVELAAEETKQVEKPRRKERRRVQTYY